MQAEVRILREARQPGTDHDLGRVGLRPRDHVGDQRSGRTRRIRQRAITAQQQHPQPLRQRRHFCIELLPPDLIQPGEVLLADAQGVAERLRLLASSGVEACGR